MDTEVQSDSIEQLLRVIAALKGAGRQDEEEEHLGALFDILFAGNGLRYLVNEQVINKVDSVMSANSIWEKYPAEKETLGNQKILAHEIHSKLYSVLDLRIDIDTLLYSRLNSWPSSGNLEAAFSQSDKEHLQEIREGANDELSAVLMSFFKEFFGLLVKGGTDVTDPAQLVSIACKEYEKLEQRTHCLALFVESNAGTVSSIQLKLSPGITDATAMSNVSEEMKQAAQIAARRTYQVIGIPAQFNIEWRIEPAGRYDGKSIGLPFSIALLGRLQPTIRIDCYTGFTGEIDFQTDTIKKVGHIREKLLGAASFGLRRVFLPKDNEEDVHDLSIPDLEIVLAQSISEVRTKLVAFSLPMKAAQAGPTIDAQLKTFEIKCKGKGISVIPGKDIGTYGRQFIISDFRHEIPVNVYFGRKGLNWIVNGNKQLELYALGQQLCVEAFGPAPQVTTPQQDFKWIVKDTTLRSTVERQLRSLPDCKEENEKNCQYRLDFRKGKEAVQVRQFSNGTLTVRGIPAGTQLFTEICRIVELSLGISPDSSASSSSAQGTEETHQTSSAGRKFIPESAVSWIGTDESGKGDYFGPLVSAGVCIDKGTERELKTLGVKDSKMLSDSRNRELAKKIRMICTGRYAEVLIPPRTYNNLYAQFRREGKSLNTLLAWGHARAIEDILKNVQCEYALADQFADEHFIISKLQEAGRKLTLFQTPKAEEDISVAAASILARDKFLSYLDKMAHDYAMRFPKGASAEVIKAAKDFVLRHGQDKLGDVAKLHFRTTKEVLDGKQVIE